MPSSIAIDLFAVIEKQIGSEAARAAATAYLANSNGSAEKPKRVLSDEHKAKMKAGREAAAAKKAAGGSESESAPSPVKATVPVASEEKPKRIISEEQKAKMKAGREAALAKKAAEKAAGGAESESAPSPPKNQPSPQSDSSASKKRGPKPLKDMTAEERAIHDAKVAERSAKKAAEKAALQLLPASPSE
jgi:hypothetical protein